VPGVEIVFVLGGGARIEAAGITCRLGVSDILLLSRCTAVTIKPVSVDSGENCLLSILRIAPAFLSFAFGGDIPAFVCNTTDPGSRDYTALRGILAETACSGMAGSDDNALILNSVLFRLLRELKQNYAVSGEGNNTEEDDESRREREITAYIKKNYRYPLALEELADKLRLSPPYLSRYFKKRFGITFHGYLNRIRLESAVKDLILSEATVTAVAYDSGFPNLNSFLNTLKDSTGKTPTEYRRAHRTRERKTERAAGVEGNAESVLALEKLRPYLKTENDIFYQKKSIVIDVDARKGMDYEQPWGKVINLGFARDFVKGDFFNQINLLQKEAPFRYGRFQGLFGGDTAGGGEPRQGYNFVQTDRVINFLYDVKLIPFIELGLKPDMISGKHGEIVFEKNGEAKDIPVREYEKMVDKFLKHMVNRFGIQEIGRWYFEIWAPCGFALKYSKAEIDIYIEQFVRIRKIIKDIAPAALVGGPGYNLTRTEDLSIMAGILHALEERAACPDFFSLYAYSFSEIPAESSDMNDISLLLWEKDENTKRIVWAKDFIQSTIPVVKRFFVTEWNLDYSSRNRLHDSLIKAPFILQNCINAVGSIDILAYWTASDISAEYNDSSSILFGGPGLISRHGIRKPSFFAYHFLSQLGDTLLDKGEGYIVTVKSKNSYTAIVFNYKYINNQSRLRNDYQDLSRDPSEFLENKDKLTIRLRINNIEPGKYKIRHHILNNHWGSVYDAWKSMSATEELSDSEASWLERACVPALRIDFLEGKENIAMECELEPNEVRLLEVSLILE
jgi:beta-xylosidase/AraC-like DNA-binding protein